MAGNSSAILSRFSSSGSLLSPTHTYPFFWVEKALVIYRKMGNRRIKNKLDGNHFFILLTSMKLYIFSTLVTQL